MEPIHVIEATSNSSLLTDLHDNKMVSSEKLMQLKEDLNHIKRVTNDNFESRHTSWGEISSHDPIEGVVFRSNMNSDCRTIMLFNADSL